VKMGQLSLCAKASTHDFRFPANLVSHEIQKDVQLLEPDAPLNVIKKSESRQRNTAVFRTRVAKEDVHGCDHASYNCNCRSAARRRRLVRPWTLVLIFKGDSFPAVGILQRSRSSFLWKPGPVTPLLVVQWPFSLPVHPATFLPTDACAASWVRQSNLVIGNAQFQKDDWRWRHGGK